MDSTIFKLAWTFSEISMSEGFSSDSLHTKGYQTQNGSNRKLLRAEGLWLSLHRKYYFTFFFFSKFWT